MENASDFVEGSVGWCGPCRRDVVSPRSRSGSSLVDDRVIENQRELTFDGIHHDCDELLCIGELMEGLRGHLTDAARARRRGLCRVRPRFGILGRRGGRRSGRRAVGRRLLALVRPSHDLGRRRSWRRRGRLTTDAAATDASTPSTRVVIFPRPQAASRLRLSGSCSCFRSCSLLCSLCSSHLSRSAYFHDRTTT